MSDSVQSGKENIKEMLYNFIQWITDIMHLSGDEVYAMVTSYSHSIQNSESLDEVIEIVMQFIYSIKNFLSSRNVVSDEVSKAISYMKQNYAHEISLQDLAKHVSLSPSYFSSLFKKEVQINIIEYLNEIRVENAKILLKETSLKSYEIAEKVGFKESTYFSTLFKNVTGLSPNKFRSIWQKNVR